MKIHLICVFLSLFVPLKSQTTGAEPDTVNVFFGLARDTAQLVPLERQAATIHTSAKFVGIGANAKSTAEFKPGRSPIRFKSSTTEFIVRSPVANAPVDFATLYVLRVLTSKGSKRELIIAKAHAWIGAAGSSSNLSEGEVPIQIVKYGESSLKSTPEKPLPPGEYALSFRAAYLNLFCFGIDE